MNFFAAYLAVGLAMSPAAGDEEKLGAEAWRNYKSDRVSEGWQLAGDILTLVKSPAGDLISREIYSDFELTLEWKIAPGGNSGIFFHVQERPDLPQVYFSGPEYQILDNHGRDEPPLEQAGALFGLYAPQSDYTRPVGEFNQSKIKVVGSQVEHWLNGHLLVAYDLNSADFKARVAASKFAQWPDFAAHRQGHIALQDHGDEVTYRNIRIRRLK